MRCRELYSNRQSNERIERLTDTPNSCITCLTCSDDIRDREVELLLARACS